MGGPRALHTATLLPSGKVLVTGGTASTSATVNLSATAELYDPTTGTWSPTDSMGTSRESHTATLLTTGKVLIVGGTATLGNEEANPEVYDPDTGHWTSTGPMEVGSRAFHTATLLPSGQVLVVGGFTVVPAQRLASAQLFDPVTGDWHPTGSLGQARAFHTATLLPSGKVLVAGGAGDQDALGSVELYDPATGTWTSTAPMSDARYFHTATLLPSGIVMVAGGTGSAADFLTETELFDPATETWRRTGSLLLMHTSHSATLLPSGRILLVDGNGDYFFGQIANTEIFDPEAESWSDAGCTVEPRSFHTATLLLSGRVLVAGGFGLGSSSAVSAELYGVIVSPAQVSLAPGASETFTAKGGSGLGYIWSFVRNESGGTLTASGDYRAGPVGGVSDALQVMDSFANSSTVTVNVVRQAAAVSSTPPQAKSMGCGTTGGAALPSLGGAVLLLLGWRWLRVRRPRSP